MDDDRFTIIEHTADVGVRAQGVTRADAFANTVLGMYSIIVEPGTIRPVESRTITVTGPTAERRLVNLLVDCLHLTETQHFVFSDVAIEERGPSLEARGHGGTLDFDRHDIGPEIKAVTTHGLIIEERPDGWTVQVILDI